MSWRCLGTFFWHFLDILPKPSWTPGHFFDIFGTFCRRPPKWSKMTPKTFWRHFFANPGKPQLERVLHIIILFWDLGAGRLFREIRIFFRGKKKSGQNRIFDPFSRVSGPGRRPKRSGTSFLSTLHPWMPRNLFLGPGFEQSLQFVKSVIFPAFFLFLATPPSHLQPMG